MQHPTCQTDSRPLLRRFAAAALVPALLVASQPLAGCQSTSRRDAMTLYDDGNYEAALRKANKVYNQSGEKDERAALLAGMSAYELEHDIVASRWLEPLVESHHRGIAGRACATLGLIDVRRGEFDEASQRFAAAGRLLQGGEAARANMFAGDCYSVLGRAEAAKLMYRLARGGVELQSSERLVDSRLRDSDFMVQLGAFRSRERAEVAAAQARARARRLGLSDPRIVLSTDVAGGVLHLVQIGPFPSQAEANAARVRMGTEAVVVSAVD